MAIGSIIFVTMGLGPTGERMGDRGMFGAIIPLVIGAVLMLIAIVGLRRRRSKRHY